MPDDEAATPAVRASFALPPKWLCRVDSVARRARWAWFCEHMADDPMLIGPCTGCGDNAGSWCEMCALDGVTFVTHVTRQTMVGSPLCDDCLRERAMCRQCREAQWHDAWWYA